jgi:hypothetical protein
VAHVATIVVTKSTKLWLQNLDIAKRVYTAHRVREGIWTMSRAQQLSESEKFFWRKDPSNDLTKDVDSHAKPGEPPSTTPQKPELKSKTLIGIPCHNAESTIGRAIVQLSPLGADIIICDDGSSDTTEDIATKMGAMIVKHPRELGRSDSVTSLFLAAKKLQAEVLLTVGQDSKHSLTDVTKLIGIVQKGGVDIAIGSDYSQEAIDAAHHDGDIKDPSSLFRAYGKKALAMIAPLGTNSVVLESEVLDFADQQGLKIREYATGSGSGLEAKHAKPSPRHFESRVMDYVSVKHPLVFYGIPAVGFFYLCVLNAIEASNLAQFSIENLTRFGMSLLTSPLLLASVALSVGSALLYSLKENGKQKKEKEERERL